MSERLTIVAFRHGKFPLNERARLVGLEALEAVKQGIPSDADQKLGLLPEGIEQATRLQQPLAEFAIDLCMTSPTLRTKRTAEIALAHHEIPPFVETGMLRERSRGIYSYAPDWWTGGQISYQNGKRSARRWQPIGPDYNGNFGESIDQVAAERVPAALEQAHELAPGGTVAFSTHGEYMLALRVGLLGLNDTQCRQPLVLDPPSGIRALQSANWVGHGQIDTYEVERTSGGWRATSFRAIGTEPDFDTNDHLLSFR